jgi:hypothetical protein
MTMKAHGDQLVDTICKGQGNTDAAANELVTEVWQGYPVENLRRLLQSSNAEAVKTGAWIASELGHLAAPLLLDTPALLQHPNSYVRFYALDIVLVNASTWHGELIATAIGLIQDSDKGVRWKSMHFISKASTDQLRAGRRHLTHHALAANLNWLLRSTNIAGTNDIVQRIAADDPLGQRFAAAAAARISDQTIEPLERAAASPEEDVSSFAASELRVQKIRRRE